MRRILILAAAAAVTLGSAADARRHSSGHHAYHHRSYHPRTYHHRSYAPSHHAASGYYRAHSGHYVHRPMHSSSRPDGATARCRDGSWSFSESRRGTCSWHGGVASWVR